MTLNPFRPFWKYLKPYRNRILAGLVLLSVGQLASSAIPLATLRACIGFVPQDTFLFSDSLRENICLGSDRATETDVRWASEVAGLSSGAYIQ